MADLTQEQLQEIVQAVWKKSQEANPNALPAQTQPQQQAPAPEPIKLNLGGQEHSFSTAEDANQFLSQYEQRVQSEIESHRRAASRPVNIPQTPPTKEAPDPVKFATLLVEDPIAAMDYIDEHRYGFKSREILPKALEMTAASQRELQAINFKMTTPDYEESPENAEAMMQIMADHGLAWNAKNLGLAWAKAKEAGLVEVKKAEEKAETPEKPAQTFTNPPAAGTRQAEPTKDWTSMVEDLNPDQLLQLANQLQGQ